MAKSDTIEYSGKILEKVEAWRMECSFCKEGISASSMCNTCGNKQEIIAVEIGNGKIQFIRVG